MTAIKRFQGSPLPGSDRAALSRCYAFKHSPVGALSGYIPCNIFVSFSLLESWVEKGFCFLSVFESFFKDHVVLDKVYFIPLYFECQKFILNKCVQSSCIV